MKSRALILAACLVSLGAAHAAPSGGTTPAAPAVPAPVAPVPLEIVIYDKPDFKGSSLRISRAVADLTKLKFDNRVASLQILGAGDWVLCENRNYQGRCARVQLQAGNLKLFQLNDRVSSLYPVPVQPVPPAVQPVITPTTNSKSPN